MTLSVVIPAWSGTPELVEMLLTLCEKVRPMCDELVVTEDSNTSNQAIESLVDIYLVHPRMGHSLNLGTGLRAATGDFIAMMDSDMEILEGNLRDLCVPEKVVSPISVQNRYDEVAGWFIVCPKKFLDAFPLYEQPSQAIVEGIDVWTRGFHDLYKDKFESSNKVLVRHGKSRTYTAFQRYAQSLHAEESKNRREIMPERHKARLLEDPIYAAEWGGKE